MQSVTRDTIIDGRYRVMRRIGAGGMADVYCVEDTQLGRRVALKLLYRRFAEDDEFVERFRREASAAAGLQHPNVVQVFDRGEWDGTYYIAMEYVAGRSLKEIVGEEGALHPDRAIDLVLQVLKAARFAHKRGIVHRDLKPQNVLVDEEGTAKVADFGIARAGASDMTETGSIMGTAQYLSPEQAQGHAVDGRADLYSIGIMLYELLTGRVPFDAEAAVTIALKQVSEEPVPPSRRNPAVSPALEAVVGRALQKDPANRYQSAEAFAAALESARAAPAGGPRAPLRTGAYPVAAEAVTPYPDGEPERRGGRGWLVALAIVLLLGAGLVAFLFLRPQPTTVPNVVGLSRDTAAERLNAAGFEVRVNLARSDARRDRVLRQAPRARMEADEGSTVLLTVSSGPGSALVPTVGGLSPADARSRLEEAGFKSRESGRYDDEVPRGQVIDSQPPAGERLERGRTVTLRVSRGPRPVTVPDMRGKPRSAAEQQLEDLGLEAEVRRVVSEDQDPGLVLSTDPPPGGSVARGGTVVLVVSRAPEREPVPDVTELDAEDAVREIEDAGFRVRESERAVTDPAQDGVVLEQRPAAGERRTRGARVTIVVGRLQTPAGQPTPTPTPSATP